MAKGFNLTAEINLRGPSNIRTIVADIRRQLGTVSAPVKVKIDPSTTRNITALTAAINRLNTSLSDTNRIASQASSSLNSLAGAGRQVSTSLSGLPRNIQAAATSTNTLQSNMRQAAKNMQAARTEFEEFGRQAALATRRAIAFSVAAGSLYKITNAINSATTEFIAFNKELVRVAQVTDTSVQNLGGLVKEITSLSTGFGVASKDLIQISSTLAQAGLSARDTEKALKALALSALAPSFDNLNDTVEGSIALMRQFGIGAGDLEAALGSINAVAAKFAVESSDIITAIQRTGGVFASASRGVSEGKDALNEFIAVFTSIRATTRESAETIATGLRTIFARIQRTDTIDALKEFGVRLTDLQGKFVGPFEAVKRLSESLNQLDPRDLRFARIVEELGGFRQIGKVIPLIQQFTTAQQALAVAQQGQRSLTADAATAQQALAVKISKVREEFIALIRSIGQSDGFQNFVKLSLDLASALIRVADSAKGVLPALTAIAAIRGASFLTQFATGFAGGIRRTASNGPRMAAGGVVPGYGDTDTVHAMLTPGEFVIRKKAVEKIGVNRLHALNRNGGGPVIQRLNQGGPVQRLNRGTYVKETIGSLNQTKGGSRIVPNQLMQSTDFAGTRIDYQTIAINKKDFENIYQNINFERKKTRRLNRLYGGNENALKSIKKARGSSTLESIDQKSIYKADNPLKGLAFERYIKQKYPKLNIRGGNKGLESLLYSPLDFDVGDAKFGNDTTINRYKQRGGQLDILSKRLRQQNIGNALKWTKKTPESRQLSPTTVFIPPYGIKTSFDEWYADRVNKELNQQNQNILKKYNGGYIQKFMAGGAAKAAKTPTALTPQNLIIGPGHLKENEWRDTLRDIITQNGLTTDTARNLLIDEQKISLSDAFSSRQLSSARLRERIGPENITKLEKLRADVASAYSGKRSGVIEANRPRTPEEVGEAQKKNLLFGAAGMYGSRFPATQIALSEADGLKSRVDATVFGALLDRDAAERKARLNKRNILLQAAGVDENKDSETLAIKSAPTSKGLSKFFGYKASVTGVGKANKQLAIDTVTQIAQSLSPNTGGSQIFLDFDKTLAFGADNIGPKINKKKPNYSAFGNPQEVQTGLNNAKLSNLGVRLKKLVSDLDIKSPGLGNELLRKMFVVSARPPQTMSLIAQWLSNKGLNIPTSNISGVGGVGMGPNNIAMSKAEQILKMAGTGSVFIDDDATNIDIARNKGIRSIQYGSKVTKKSKKQAAQQEGLQFEQFISEQLPANLKTKMLRGNGEGIDFPSGLGADIAQNWFRDGRLANIPVDTKRTLTGPRGKIKDNIISYLKTQGYAFGGLVRLGIGGGVRLPKGRGKNETRGARDVAEPISTETYLKWAKGIYDEYDADPSLTMAIGAGGARMPPEIALANLLLTRMAFAGGGAGLKVGRRFVRTPLHLISSELKPYLVPDPSDPSQLGFYKDLVAKFLKPKSLNRSKRGSEQSKINSTSKMQAKLARAAMVGVAKGSVSGNLTKEQSEILSPETLGAIAKDQGLSVASVPRLKTENLKSVGDSTSIKPKFIAWSKNPSGGVFGDVVAGFEDKIRSQLQEPNKSHFDALIKTRSLDAYKESGGKDGHIPPLKKAIYSIVGLTKKSLGGLISNFNSGGLAQKLATVKRFASGGKVDYYSLEKNSGFNSSEFNSLVQFAKTNNFNITEFKAYLAKRLQEKKSKSGLIMNPGQLLTAIKPQVPQATDKQNQLAQQLMSDQPDYQYRPKNRFAVGGSVEDTVPALLTPGEFVINKKAAQRIGASRLHQLNKADKIQGFNKGGSVGGIQKFAFGGKSQRLAQVVDSFDPVDSTSLQALDKAVDTLLSKIVDGIAKANPSISFDDALQQAQQTKQGRTVSPTASFGLMRQAETGDQKAANMVADIQKQQVNSLVKVLRAQDNSISVSQAKSAAERRVADAWGGLYKRIGEQETQSNLLTRAMDKARGLYNRMKSPLTEEQQKRQQQKRENRQAWATRGMTLAFTAPIIAEQLGTAIGGKTGAGISGAANAFSSAVGVGAQLGPQGALVGAIAGIVMAFDGYNNAIKEKEKELNNTKIEQASKTADENLERLMKNPNNAVASRAVMESISAMASAEESNMKLTAEQRKPTMMQRFGAAVSFGLYDPTRRSEEDITRIGQENTNMNRAAADRAMAILTTKVNTGIGFEQALKSTGNAELIKTQIAQGAGGKFATREADLMLQREKYEGKTDDYSKKAVSVLDKQIEENRKAAFESATAALKAADADIQRAQAAKKLAQAINVASVSIDRTFKNMESSLNAASSSLSVGMEKLDAMANNRTAKASFSQQNVLENPYAYSAKERQNAVKQASGFFGEDAGFVVKLTEVSSNIKDTMARITTEAQQSGTQTKEETAQKIQRSIDQQLINSFGDNNVSRQISEQLRAALEEQKKSDTKEIDFDKLMADTTGLSSLIEAEQKAFKALADATKFASDSLNAYQEQLVKAASMMEEANNIMSESIATNAANSFRLTEMMGGRVTLGERFDARRQELASRAGVRASDFNVKGLVNRLSQLNTDRTTVQGSKDTFEKNNQFTDPKTLQGLRNFTSSLVGLDSQINRTRESIKNLPKDLQGFIDDTFNSMQEKIGKLEAKQQASASFAEKMVTSTPTELMELNNTYSLITNTLNGQVRTIQQSVAAQQAYIKSIQDGSTEMDAMMAAQSAFANENKNAFAMFSELLTIANVEKQDANNMRASFLENMANSQGLNVQNSPFFKMLIDSLRKKPEEDPQIKALRDTVRALMEEQRIAAEAAAKIARDDASKLVQEAGNVITAAINQARIKFDEQQLQSIGLGISRPAQVINREKGGMVYASSGKFIPRGTDTVPAMLSPGEFVVNAASTQKNLPLLDAINKNKGGMVQYLSRGSNQPVQVKYPSGDLLLDRRGVPVVLPDDVASLVPRGIVIPGSPIAGYLQARQEFPSGHRITLKEASRAGISVNKWGYVIDPNLGSSSGRISRRRAAEEIDLSIAASRQALPGSPATTRLPPSVGPRASLLPADAPFGQGVLADIKDTVSSTMQNFGDMLSGVSNMRSNLASYFSGFDPWGNKPFFGEKGSGIIEGGLRLVSRGIGGTYGAIKNTQSSILDTLADTKPLSPRLLPRAVADVNPSVVRRMAGTTLASNLINLAANAVIGSNMSNEAATLTGMGIDVGTAAFGAGRAALSSGSATTVGGVASAGGAAIMPAAAGAIALNTGFSFLSEGAQFAYDREAYRRNLATEEENEYANMSQQGWMGATGSTAMSGVRGLANPARTYAKAVRVASSTGTAVQQAQTGQQKLDAEIAMQQDSSTLGGRLRVVERDVAGGARIIRDSATGRTYDLWNRTQKKALDSLVSSTNDRDPLDQYKLTAQERNWVRQKAKLEDDRTLGKISDEEYRKRNGQLEDVKKSVNKRYNRGYIWGSTPEEKQFKASDDTLDAAVKEQRTSFVNERIQAAQQAAAQAGQAAMSAVNVGIENAQNVGSSVSNTLGLIWRGSINSLSEQTNRNRKEREAVIAKAEADRFINTGKEADKYIQYPAVPDFSLMVQMERFSNERSDKLKQLSELRAYVSNVESGFYPLQRTEKKDGHSRDVPYSKKETEEWIKQKREEEKQLVAEIDQINQTIINSNQKIEATTSAEDRQAQWTAYRKSIEREEQQENRKAALRARQQEKEAINRIISSRNTVAKASGIPLPKNSFGLPQWRSRVLKVIGDRFFLSGNETKDREFLGSLGMRSEVLDTLFGQDRTPGSLTEPQMEATYAIMSKEREGIYRKYSDKDLQLLRMYKNEEQIVKLHDQYRRGFTLPEERRRELERAREKVFAKAQYNMMSINELVAESREASPGKKTAIANNLFKRLIRQGYIQPNTPDERNVARLTALGMSNDAIQLLYPNQAGGAVALMRPQNNSRGGIVYASKGTLVPYEPRGTDTVPAMLTPGEFVVNAKATSQHLPLLKAINNGETQGYNKGGVVYLQEGSDKPLRSYLPRPDVQSGSFREGVHNRQYVVKDPNYSRTLQQWGVPHILQHGGSKTYRDKYGREISENEYNNLPSSSFNHPDYTNMRNRAALTAGVAKSAAPAYMGIAGAGLGYLGGPLAPITVPMGYLGGSILGAIGQEVGLNYLAPESNSRINQLIEENPAPALVGDMIANAGFTGIGSLALSQIPRVPKIGDSLVGPGGLTAKQTRHAEKSLNRPISEMMDPLLGMKKLGNRYVDGPISVDELVYRARNNLAESIHYSGADPKVFDSLVTRFTEPVPGAYGDYLSGVSRISPKISPENMIATIAHEAGHHLQTTADPTGQLVKAWIDHNREKVSNLVLKRTTSQSHQMRTPRNSMNYGINDILGGDYYKKKTIEQLRAELGEDGFASLIDDALGHQGIAIEKEEVIAALESEAGNYIRARTGGRHGEAGLGFGKKGISRIYPDIRAEVGIRAPNTLTIHDRVLDSITRLNKDKGFFINDFIKNAETSGRQEFLTSLFQDLGGSDLEARELAKSLVQFIQTKGGEKIKMTPPPLPKPPVMPVKKVKGGAIGYNKGGIVYAQNGMKVPNNKLNLQDPEFGVRQAAWSIIFPQLKDKPELIPPYMPHPEVLEKAKIREQVYSTPQLTAGNFTAADLKQEELAWNARYNRLNIQSENILGPIVRRESQYEADSRRATVTGSEGYDNIVKFIDLATNLAEGYAIGRSTTKSPVLIDTENKKLIQKTRPYVSGQRYGRAPDSSDVTRPAIGSFYGGNLEQKNYDILLFKQRINDQIEAQLNEPLYPGAKMRKRDDDLYAGVIQEKRQRMLERADLLFEQDANRLQIRKRNNDTSTVLSKPNIELPITPVASYQELQAELRELSAQDIKALLKNSQLLGEGYNSAAWSLTDTLALYLNRGTSPSSLLDLDFDIRPRSDGDATSFESQFGGMVGVLGLEDRSIGGILGRVRGVQASASSKIRSMTGSRLGDTQLLDLLSVMQQYDSGVFAQLFMDQWSLADKQYITGLSDAKLANFVFGQNRIVPVDIGRPNSKAGPGFPTSGPFNELEDQDNPDYRQVIISQQWLRTMENSLINGLERQGLDNLLDENPRAFLERLQEGFQFLASEQDPRANSREVLGESAKTLYAKIRKQIVERLYEGHKNAVQQIQKLKDQVTKSDESIPRLKDSPNVAVHTPSILYDSVGPEQWVQEQIDSGKTMDEIRKMLEQRRSSGTDFVPVSEMTIPLFRGEGLPDPNAKPMPEWLTSGNTYKKHAAAFGRWFTTSSDLAEKYGQMNDAGFGYIIKQLRTTIGEADQYRVSNLGLKSGGKDTAENPAAFSLDPTREWYLPKELSQQANIIRKQYGGLIYANEGTLVNYQPRGTDTVPAMLTPGEFVVNAKATSQHLPLLKAINNGETQGYNKGGVVYLQNGGLSCINCGQSNCSCQKLAKGGQAKKPQDSKNPPQKQQQMNMFPLGNNNQQYPQGITYDLRDRQQQQQAINSAYIDLLPYTSGPLGAARFSMLFAQGLQNTSLQFSRPGNIGSTWPLPDGQIVMTMPTPMVTKSLVDHELGHVLQIAAKRLGMGMNLIPWIQNFAQYMNIVGFKADHLPIGAGGVGYYTAQDLLDKPYEVFPIILQLKSQDPQGFSITDGDQALQMAMYNMGFSNGGLVYASKGGNICGGCGKSSCGCKSYVKGDMIYANKGALVNYQPRGTDTVPAMLTPGEFVVNRKATQQNLPLLQSINSGNYSSGGIVYLSEGGRATLSNRERELKQRREALAKQIREEKERVRQKYEDDKLFRKEVAYTSRGMSVPARFSAPLADAHNRKIERERQLQQENIPNNNDSSINNFNQVNQILNAFGRSITMLTDNINELNSQLSQTRSITGVSNKGQQTPSLDGLGQFITKFDQFIQAVQAINLPPIINLQVAPIQVNITGAEALRAALEGPMGEMLQRQIQQSFAQLSAATEGAIRV